MKVLVLDDSSVLHERLRAILSDRPDIEVLNGTGEPLDAIRLVRELRPDAVIVDVRAHKRLGIDILLNIKKIAPAPLVVTLTNRFCPGNREKCMADEVDFSFDKFTEMDKVSAVFA
jgi:DNA-binding NarL/FixJ family response regulator